MQKKQAVLLMMAMFSSVSQAADLQFTDTAKVMNVEEIMKTVSHTTPNQVCWNEEVPVYGKSKPDSYTSEILGGILGGVIGNQLGGGTGKKVMTGAGALLGASVGSDYDQQRAQKNIVSYREVERCRQELSVREEVVTDYYRVTLDYNGSLFDVRKKEKPQKEMMNVEISLSAI